uniref:Annexin n=1 Tax=Panagrolaimus sp. JU765 TaxID=591449 RepID=A0AC34Q614_9BILA
MPNLNSLIGGLANVASHLQSSRGGSNNPTPNQGGNGYPNQGSSAYPNQGNSAYPNQSGSGYTGYGGNTGGPQAYQGYGGVYGNGQRYDGGQSPPSQGGYPPSMPSQGGYPSMPSQGAYPPSMPSQGGYPPSVPSQGGYPPSTPSQGGYPPSMPSQGGYQPYPNQQSYQSYGNAPQPGYPSQPSFGGGNNSPYAGSSSVPYPTTDVGPGFAPSLMALNQVHMYPAYPNLGQGAQQPSAPPQYQSAYAPQMWNNPSIRPVAGFNANADAEALRKAMKGLGCNNSKVVAVLCGRSNWQRQEISKAFKVMYGKDLIKELKGELSGDFEDLIMALMEPPARYDAMQLYKAMAGLGTKESVLIEIMTTRTNAQIQELKMTYKQLYGHDLERDLIGETSGHFKRLLVSLCAGGRDESNYTDPLRANQDARNLYRAGEQRLGTDESCFNAILASQNMYQLRMVFDEYQKVTKHSIEKAIETEFSGDIRDGLLAVVKSIRYRPAYFAELLNNSMRGFGTRDNDLIRLVVTRAEIDLRDIQQSYHQLYKTSLENAIAGDCSGAYKEGLIALVKGNY